MFKPKCDPMAALIVGAVEEAGQGLVRAVSPEKPQAATACAQGSVWGDVLGSVSHGELGRSHAPMTPPMPVDMRAKAPSIWG